MPFYECDACDKSYASKYSLDRHAAQVHKNVEEDEEEEEEDEEEDEDDDVGDSQEQVDTLGEYLEEILEELQEDPDIELSSVDDLVAPDNYSKIRDMFVDKVRAIDNKMYALRRTDLFQGIEAAVTRHEEHIDDITECEDAAWDDRRFALKSFIKENADKLEEKLFPKEEEEDQ